MIVEFLCKNRVQFNLVNCLKLKIDIFAFYIDIV